MYAGDISNCYDELDHDRCLEGVRWALNSLPKWLNKRQIRWFTCSKTDRKDCRIGCSSEDDRINIDFDSVFEVCVFDCRNSVILVHGELRRRILGAPMGGFLSAFYAVLCFAFIESVLVQPEVLKIGLPGGVRRYLDDVLAIFKCYSVVDEARVNAFMKWIASADVYPPPLKLNVEPEGDQDFLEARVFTRNGDVCVKLNNKVVSDITSRKEQYRRRLPDTADVSYNTARSLVTGVATRAVQATSADADLLHCCLLELQVECLACGYGNRLIKKALCWILKRYGSEHVQKAIIETGLI